MLEPSQSELYRQLDAIRQTHDIAAGFVSIVQNNERIFHTAFGAKLGETAGAKTTTQTLFQAASISKSLNAIGILRLVEQGKLDLDTDVQHYLQRWKIPAYSWQDTEKVTLRRLLSHQAGITTGGFAYEPNAAIPSLVDLLQGHPPAQNEPILVVHCPGTIYDYSNFGIAITQMIIEDVTGCIYADWMAEHVLRPLGMINSRYTQPERQDVAIGHWPDGRAADQGWHVYVDQAAGGLWTNADDMARFMLSVLSMLAGTDGVLSSALMQQAVTSNVRMAKTGSDRAGLGFILSKLDGMDVIWHNGGNNGYSSLYVVYPQQNLGYAVFLNCADAHPVINEMSQPIAGFLNVPPFLGT